MDGGALNGFRVYICHYFDFTQLEPVFMQMPQPDSLTTLARLPFIAPSPLLSRNTATVLLSTPWQPATY